MAVAAWKDLCVDVLDAEVMAPFWAGTLGLSAQPHPRREAVVALVGPSDRHRVWLNTVPEPVTVKQRVHLDVDAGSTREVLDRGATVLAELGRWDLLADPEGGELCVFTRESVPAYRLYELVVDAVDPAAISGWWAEVLGATAQHGGEPDGYSWFEDAPGVPFESWLFQPVPEPKTVKNRIHWDVDGDVAALVEAGAVVLREPDGDVSWTVMADPEGNEFCCFAPE